MANINTNPTRMEYMRLKSRLKTTMRGHKLLKDRADEMIRQFVVLIHINRELREKIEGETTKSLRAFSIAQSSLNEQEIQTAFAVPSFSAHLETEYDSLMGIDVPKLKLGEDKSHALPYSFASTVSGLDESIIKITHALESLIRLAEVEKTCDILADEIEKIRRRVNALEQFTIPQILSEMKRIMLKLDENERSNLVRLMKVKTQISKDK